MPFRSKLKYPFKSIKLVHSESVSTGMGGKKRVSRIPPMAAAKRPNFKITLGHVSHRDVDGWEERRLCTEAMMIGKGYLRVVARNGRRST